MARKDGSGNVTYYFEEPAGRTCTITGATGVACNEADYYLFGGEQTHGNTCDQNYHFAGMYRDGETANDYTQFRMYESNLGRWMTPDPVAGDISNPQSLNRYAYAMNNPTNLIDPLGLDDNCVWNGQAWDCGYTISTTSSAGMPAGSPDDAHTVDTVNFEPLIHLWLNSPWPGSSQEGGGRGGAGGGASTGSRYGLRSLNQTFSQCMEQNANAYSIGGSIELAVNVATGTNSSYLSGDIPGAIVGNNITTLFFGSTTQAGGSMAANAPNLVSTAMGSPTSWGRRTTEILSLNLAGKGGVPLALGRPAAGAKAMLGKVGNVLSLGMSFTTKLGVDAAFTAAEGIGCSMTRSW